MRAAAFDRTLGALRSDGRGRSFAALVIAIVVLAVWVVWASLFGISVYRTSSSARFEVTPAAARVASSVEGRVTSAQLVVGSQVAAGDALVELDATNERIAADKARARVTALVPELESIEQELAAEQDARRSGSDAELDTERQISDRLRAARASLAAAERELAREMELAKSGATPTADRDRAETTAVERRAAVAEIEHELKALGATHRVAGDTRVARFEQLSRQRAELANELASQRAEVDRLSHEVERRTIRAPVAGTLGEVATLRPGAVVHAGDVVATVVPPGRLHVVAEYGAVALGRVAPGQRARLRLDGFPWTRYGTVPARVARVGSELRDGTIRVELDLTEEEGSLPVQHGMTCSVDIEIERTSPASLLLRTVGESLDRGGTQ
jgi:membrane fusion protein (multidrug efflux system)